MTMGRGEEGEGEGRRGRTGERGLLAVSVQGGAEAFLNWFLRGLGGFRAVAPVVPQV